MIFFKIFKIANLKSGTFHMRGSIIRSSIHLIC